MTGKCPTCGKEYSVTVFRPDSGFCPEHTRFCSNPLWFNPTPACTRPVWRLVVVIHAGYLLFFFPLLNIMTSDVGIPVSVYALTVVVYFGIRFAVAKRRGYPILTGFQRIALLLLPFYGPVGSFWLFYLGQVIRYGRFARF